MFDIFKVTPTVYNRKRASYLVLRIRKTKDSNKRNKYQLELFNLMSKLVVKNINNYLKLTYNSPVKEDAFNSTEMQSEAFLVLDNCVQKFKLEKGKNCFYFYYNKSLSRSFYKMFNTMIVGQDRFNQVREGIVQRKLKATSQHYGIDLVISQLGLNDDEILVLNSKLLGQSKQDFLDENRKFPSTQYYKCNCRIKSVIQKLIEDGEL